MGESCASGDMYVCLKYSSGKKKSNVTFRSYLHVSYYEVPK